MLRSDSDWEHWLAEGETTASMISGPKQCFSGLKKQWNKELPLLRVVQTPRPLCGADNHYREPLCGPGRLQHGIVKQRPQLGLRSV